MQSLFLLILKKIEHHLKVAVTVKRVSGSFIENAILAPAYLSYFFRNIYFFYQKTVPESLHRPTISISSTFIKQN